jgi:hypothetical protein
LKIVFLTNSLNPYKDGVGDWCRSLANSIEQKGHSCALISLNEKTIVCNESKEKLLYCSSTESWEKRVSKVRDFLKKFQPDYVSLQLVCYGYHPRGFLQKINPYLKQMLEGYPVILMFHELWRGAYIGANWKAKIEGYIQRNGLKKLHNLLNPHSSFTSNYTYQQILKINGITADILPMFGSIPIQKDFEISFFQKKLIENGIELNQNNRNNYWIIGTFGIMHPAWNPEEILQCLIDMTKKMGKTIIVISMGNAKNKSKFWNEIKQKFNKIRFIALGELVPEEISKWMQLCDCALTGTPFELIGKSASSAAFLDHGIPLLVDRREEYPIKKNIEKINDLILFFDEHFETRFPQIKKRSPKAIVFEVADKFLHKINF